VLCIQETWLQRSSVKLDIPGYQVYEERRAKGIRGGIALLVRKGIKVIKYVGNEYAQGVEIQVQGGDTVWVGNVYLPPTESMLKRDKNEEVARELIEDVTGSIPQNSQSVMCGDWNARIGELYPKIGETCIPRRSLDQRTGSRAPWVIALCEG
jgi:exonuclease III